MPHKGRIGYLYHPHAPLPRPHSTLAIRAFAALLANSFLPLDYGQPSASFRLYIMKPSRFAAIRFVHQNDLIASSLLTFSSIRLQTEGSTALAIFPLVNVSLCKHRIPRWSSQTRSDYYVFMTVIVQRGVGSKRCQLVSATCGLAISFRAPKLRSRAECSTPHLQLIEDKEVWLPGLDSN
jgi:hypothetical protein